MSREAAGSHLSRGRGPLLAEETQRPVNSRQLEEGGVSASLQQSEAPQGFYVRGSSRRRQRVMHH